MKFQKRMYVCKSLLKHINGVFPSWYMYVEMYFSWVRPLWLSALQFCVSLQQCEEVDEAYRRMGSKRRACICTCTFVHVGTHVHVHMYMYLHSTCVFEGIHVCNGCMIQGSLIAVHVHVQQWRMAI